MGTAEAVAGDGRRARAARSRNAIIRALIDLYREGDLTPRVETIARRAGVTPRTIHHHFRDRDTLAAAVRDLHVAEHRALFAPLSTDGSRAERLERVVSHRVALFEATAAVRRAARVVMHRSPAVADQQRAVARFLRRTLREVFESDLEALNAATAGDLLDRLDLVLSWETWDHLRSWQGKSVAEARRHVGYLATICLADLAEGAPVGSGSSA